MEEIELTIHQILEILEVEIFDLAVDDEKYYMRELLLKNSINKCFKCIKENSKAYSLGYELDHWEKYVVERNQKNFAKYISKLYSLLNRNSIISYFEYQNAKLYSNPMIEEDHMIFLINSYYTTIKYDILWAGNISVSDVIKLSQNEVDNANLIRKFPEMIKFIKDKIIPFFDSISTYKYKAETLKEAVNTFEGGHYKATSSLILIELEGLVKLLGAFLIEKQNIDKTLLKKKYHSLDSYLKQIPWLEDFEIDADQLMFLTGNFVFHKKYEIDKTSKISLDTRLNFLRRRFKENRNSVLHGDAIFGETWDLYVNFSALFEVYETVKYYENLYAQCK